MALAKGMTHRRTGQVGYNGRGYERKRLDVTIEKDPIFGYNEEVLALKEVMKQSEDPQWG